MCSPALESPTNALRLRSGAGAAYAKKGIDVTVRVAEKLTLIDPSMDYEKEFLEMTADFRHAGDMSYDVVPELIRHDFAGYVRKLHDQANGIGLDAGRVPSNTYWLLREDDRTVLGASSLRHELTPSLEIEGGHIGYRIRPSQRRKGYGTQILALTLEKAREAGLRRVLVTCDTDNITSAHIIQKNGGIFENEVISPYTGKRVSRYWIDV